MHAGVVSGLSPPPREPQGACPLQRLPLGGPQCDCPQQHLRTACEVLEYGLFFIARDMFEMHAVI